MGLHPEVRLAPSVLSIGCLQTENDPVREFVRASI